MKKLLVFASVAMIGAAASAGVVPRVYQYSASLNTAVAKNASRVTFVDCDVNEVRIINDVCYRVKGRVSVKGVIVFGCDCVDAAEYFKGDEGYPLVLMATSSDRYRQVVFSGAGIWTANRLGSPLPSKAKVAELGFWTAFQVGPTNVGSCIRWYDLDHAGFGQAGTIERGEGLDIISASGNVVGAALAPYCSADVNDCPRCLEDGICQYAIAFTPCTMDDCLLGEWDMDDRPNLAYTDYGVAFGSFSVKFSSRLSNAIKDIPDEEVQATINAVVPLAFGRTSIAPSWANYEDYFWSWNAN